MNQEKANQTVTALDKTFRKLTGLTLQQAAQQKGLVNTIRALAYAAGANDPETITKFWVAAKEGRLAKFITRASKTALNLNLEKLERECSKIPIMVARFIRFEVAPKFPLPKGRPPGHDADTTKDVLKNFMEKIKTRPRQKAKEETAESCGVSVRHVEKLLKEHSI